jgi:hypothetical protein
VFWARQFFSATYSNAPAFSLEMTFAVNDDVLSRRDHGGLDEPGQAEADQDVEDVAADGVGDGHVAVTYKKIRPDKLERFLFNV